MGSVRHGGDMSTPPLDQKGQGILTPQAGKLIVNTLVLKCFVDM